MRKRARRNTSICRDIFMRANGTLICLGEFYKGYYLTPQGLAAPEGKPYYLRPDMGLSLVGFAFYRALNERKFSYQAGLLQNEWQKKSAGSVLVGGEIYYGSILRRQHAWCPPGLIRPKVRWRLINFIFSVSDQVSVMVIR